CRWLPVSAAFHSPLVAEVQQPFSEALAEVDFAAPQLAVYANTTGLLYPSEPAAMRALLAAQLAQPVAFADEIDAMFGDGVRTFVEVGPGAKLSGLVRSILEGRDYAVLALDSSAGKRSACYDLACVLAELAARGHEIDWSCWRQGTRVSPAPAEKKP